MIKVKNNSPATGDNIKIIDEIVRRHNIHRGAAIPILQEIQTTFGFVPPEAITRISDLTGIAESELYSIATFYAQFRLEPVGKNIICVCHGTACHLAGAEKVTKRCSMLPVPDRAEQVPTGCLPWKRWPAWAAAAWHR